MDFMKVFDQTVREIKREVNLKVLKVPEIEQKVLDATDDEPWGPHGSALAEIAQATKKYIECKMVMNVLWTRLGETGKDWRYVYKALTVIEYLVANGSEEAVDDIVEHTFKISSLSGFEYVEPSGKDMGINVRKKVENIVALLNNKDKIEEVRKKAAANRDKYVGVSSAGSTYKFGSSSASYDSSSYGSDYNGGRTSRRERDSFKDDQSGESGEDKYVKSTSAKSRRGTTSGKYGESLMKSSTQQQRHNDDFSSTKLSSNGNKPSKHDQTSSQSSSMPSNNYDDEFDDFDPRETSTKPVAPNSSQVDLFGESLFGDLMDAPTSVPAGEIVTNSESADVNLFADATFVSAPSSKAPKSPTEIQVDLFSSQSAAAPGATFDFFGAPEPILQSEVKDPKSVASTYSAVDPFAAVPMSNFDGSDPFGAFASPAVPTSQSSSQNLASSLGNLSGTSSRESNTGHKKDLFQVKSGIWADSLSRGLIDLNISAPKKVNLADVGGLSDGSAEPLPSFYSAKPMSSASGYTSSPSKAINGDDFFSSLSSGQQYQFNYSKK
uniref:ENTH domain-containing protein n=1 Tax=Kalanchoe fedtschenkoi TaxID=63787 RepID=A0A7N0RDB7_KALFE